MSSTTATLARMAAQVRIVSRPVPKTLHESRQILLALQKFGEVLVFRNLKYDISNKKGNKDERPIVAILESAEAAQHAIASSPITVAIPKSPSPPTNSISSPTPTSTPSSTLESNTETTTLTCEIKPSTHNHAHTLRRNPFHLVYDIDKDTPIYADMTSPETAVPLKGLADVLQRPKRWKAAWVKPQTLKTSVRMGAHSLRELWREGHVNAEVERLDREREKLKAAKTGFRKVSLGRMRDSSGVELEDVLEDESGR